MRKKYTYTKISSRKIVPVAGIFLFLALLFAFPILTASFSNDKLAKIDFSPSNAVSASKTTLNAASDKIAITVTIVCGGHVECSKGIQPLKNATKYLESELDLIFKIEQIILSKEQPRGTIQERWQKWLDITSSLETYKSDLTVILVESYPDNIDSFDFSQEGMIGLATGLGILKVVPSTIFAKVMGSEQFMTRVLIHEIGHTLGGQHVEEGIMHPCACVNQYSDQLSHYSLQQMKTHIEAIKLLTSILTKPSTQALQSKMPEVKDAIIESLACDL